MTSAASAATVLLEDVVEGPTLICAGSRGGNSPEDSVAGFRIERGSGSGGARGSILAGIAHGSRSAADPRSWYPSSGAQRGAAATSSAQYGTVAPALAIVSGWSWAADRGCSSRSLMHCSAARSARCLMAASSSLSRTRRAAAKQRSCAAATAEGLELVPSRGRGAMRLAFRNVYY